MIELKNIKKSYKVQDDEFTALKGINIEIKKGDFIAIKGSSGSGKSTLMHILGLLDNFTEGEYIFEGQNINSLNDTQKSQIRNSKIGFVFQSFNLLPRLTAIENVLLPTLYSINEDSIQKATSLLEKVGLKGKENNRASQLSGGQIQRVAIARSLINNPSIILADEPTGNLDSKTSIDVMNLFTELNKEGNTIILVTHEDDIAAFAKRVIQIEDGLVFKEFEYEYV